MKVGVVGLGFLGMMHAKNIRTLPNAELAAVCDVQPHRLEGMMTAGNIDVGAGRVDLGGAKKYTRFEDMLADSALELIVIVTPTYLHAEMAVAALKAGKHVFCEKPMARTAKEASSMLAAAKKAGRGLMIGHCLRFWPEYVAVKEMIDSKRYGRVRGATFRRIGGTPRWGFENWFVDSKRSGHCALDMHIHDVDTAQWFFGKPSRVRAAGTVTADGGVSHVIARYDFADIDMVTAEGAWFHDGYPFSMAATIEFEQATVEYDSSKSPTLVVCRNGAKPEPQTVPAGDAYANEIKYFIDCLLEGKAPDRVPPESSVDAVATVEAEMKSVKTGKPVSLARGTGAKK
ncbi:MAG: Gfo/Idh/MocA family protein [Phycisphaerae bacterium]